MRKVILAVVTLILLPSTGLSQQPLDPVVCSQSNPSIPEARGLQVVKNEGLHAALEKAFSKSPRVVVCMEHITKSSGHGLLGLSWNKRQVEEIKFNKIKKGESNYIVTDTIKFTELKAPLGSWHIKKDNPPTSRDSKIILNSDKALSDLYADLSKADQKNIIYRITTLTR